MRGAMRALLVGACLFLTSAAAHEVTRRDTKSGGSKRVVCYYTNWSVYRPGTAKFNPQNINPYLCTHLIYAFGGLTRENGLRPYDKYQDIEQGGYAKFTGLKTYNKNLKTMLAIGGWNEGSTRFSPLVASEERRMEFVKNVVRFLRQNHFDGLDLDWEYPAFRDGGKPRDRDNYALLVQELREEFDRESSKTGRPRLLLTMAVPAGIEYIDKGYDIPKLNKYLDFMNILSYDYHSSFEPSVNHHSPLYPLEEEGEYNFDAQLSIDYTINHYLELGADRDKLVLGIPTYGRSYTLFNPDSTEIGSPADGPGEQGDATREKGYLAYYEICENLGSDEWKVEKPNPRAMGPYAYKGNQWVGYDDEDIVRKKATYVTEKGLGGIMYWAIDNDDFRGKCHGRPYPLIEAGKEAMLAASGTSNDLESTPPRGKGRPKPRTTTEEAPISNSGGGIARPSGSSASGKRRRPTIKAKTQEKRSSTTTSTTPAYSYPTSTPEPPTTPDPGSDFKCEDEGFFPHPRDCKKYFWCLDSGPSNLGIVAHQFTCPSGLFFNKAADSCDYTRNVVCNTKAKAEPATTTTSKPLTTTSKSARTTTSTTTTEAPEEEEEYEEYDEEPEEDPKAIKELIDLIKKLGGIANLEKQLHLDGTDAKEETNSATPPAISKKLYNRVLSQANNRGNSNANFYNPSASVKSSTPHTLIYKNRGRQNEGLEGLSEVNNVRQEKPQYVTIRRERPTTPSPAEEDEEEDDDEVEDVQLSSKPEEVKSSGREYVNIRREKPAKLAEEEVTTPKYSSIRRTKTSPKPEVEEAANEVPEVVLEEATTVSPVVTEDAAPVSRKKLSPFLPRTAKLGSVLEPFRRKKKEEEVTATTEEEKDDVVTVTTEASRSKVSEASQKKLSTKLPYLEVTRGRGYKLSTAQSSLEDESNVNNTSTSTTPESQTKANRSRFFRPSSTSTTTPKSSSTLEELISVPVETVPPTSTLEPASLSTTTPFVPTVTRVVTSESESATERHRISLSKYKGFYLTVPPTSSRLATQDPTKLGSTTASPNKVEKIMEVNRITQVTFKDDFAIPSTRTLSNGTTPSSAEAEAEDKVTTVVDDAIETTTSLPDDALETDTTLPDDQNDIGQPELSSATPEVTVPSTSLSTESRKRFRQPLRTTTTTRNPLPRSQRRRTTTLSPEEETPESADDQGTGRKPFVPKRRGSYRPTYKSDGDFDGSTASQADNTRTYARRPSSVLSNQFTTTNKPARFSPQYRSRDRTTLVIATTEEAVQEEFVPQEEVFQKEDVAQQPDEEVYTSAVPKIVPFRPRGRVVHSQRATTETPRERIRPVSRTVSRRPSANADSETEVKPVSRTVSRRPTTNADSEPEVKPVRVIPVSRGKTKAITSIAREFPTDEEQSNNDSQPEVIPSRKGGRVVKKIKKRPVTTTTTTTFEPTATQTTASLPSSPSEALEYESQRVGVDTTPPSPTETYSDGTTFFTEAGITDPETSVSEDYYSATSVPSEDFATAIDEEGRGIVNYEIRPRDELLYTQFSSASIEVADRGSHKFSLDDVLLGDDDEANGAIKVKKVRPSSRNRLPEVAKARKVPQSSFDASEGDQNVVTVVDNQGEDVSRDPNSKRRRVVKKKRLPEQSSSTPDGDDGKDLDSQGEGISTTARTFLRKPGGSFYANSRLRSRSTTTSTTTEAPTKLISLRPGRRQNTSASRLVVNRRRKYGGDNTTTTAASTQETVTLAALTTQASEEPEIVTLEPAKKFSFPRRRPSSNSKESSSASDAKPLSSNKTTILTVKAALHHVVDDSQNEPSTIRGVQSQEAVDDVAASTPLPDLANDAVVAIHNLATTPTRTPHRGRPFVEVSTPYSTPTLSSPHPPRISTTATPFFPRRGTAVYVTPPTQAPIHRDNIRPRPFAKIVPGATQLDQSGSVEDFEYYDSGEGIFSGTPISGKVKIHSDGYIECLDQGNFPHPFSCKKFISCAKMETSDVLGWEYTCPRHLSFDPIGGICNWSAGLGCKE